MPGTCLNGQVLLLCYRVRIGPVDDLDNFRFRVWLKTRQKIIDLYLVFLSIIILSCLLVLLSVFMSLFDIAFGAKRGRRSCRYIQKCTFLLVLFLAWAIVKVLSIAVQFWAIGSTWILPHLSCLLAHNDLVIVFSLVIDGRVKVNLLLLVGIFLTSIAIPFLWILNRFLRSLYHCLGELTLIFQYRSD